VGLPRQVLLIVAVIIGIVIVHALFWEMLAIQRGRRYDLCKSG